VAALGVLAGLTRPVGIALAMAVVVEAVRWWRPASGRERLAMVAAALGPAAGMGAYLAWVGARFDDPWLPLTVQEGEFRGDVVDPVTRLLRAAADLLSFDGDRVLDGLHLPFAVAFLALLVVVFRRWPASYGAYSAVLLLVALAADNLNSLERYALNAFPLVLGLASVTAGALARRAALGVSAAAMVGLTALALLGEYVP
jgi:general stress protein CsbA